MSRAGLASKDCKTTDAGYTLPPWPGRRRTSPSVSTAPSPRSSPASS